MNTEQPRRLQWWYAKRRKNPSGVMGRPRSPIPFAERRKAARERYNAKLAARGLRTVRLELTAEAAARLDALVEQRAVSPGAVVGELLRIVNDAPRTDS